VGDRTYGTFRCTPDRISVQLEPQAATRFKRVFERADKRASEWIALTATPENARELLWFMERYPLVPVSSRHRTRLQALAREFDRRMALVHRIVSGDYVPPKVELAHPARDYQLVPAALLACSGGVLVGDDVGLGKTVEAIVAMSDPGRLPALVVTLTHLPKQLQREIAKFLPDLKTHVLNVGRPYRIDRDRGHVAQDLALRAERGEPLPDVVITSYSKLSGWHEWLCAQLKPRYVVWDEVQEFRTGFGTARGAAGRYISQRVEARMGLSATPIHNSGAEIYPVMEVIAPGALGSSEEFTREWCGYRGLVTEPDVLGSYLRERGIYIRRTKQEVGRELPPLTISEQYCDADPEVFEDLKKSSRAIELARFVLSGKKAAFQAAGEFDLLLRRETGVAKAPYVAAFVNMLLQTGEPVVLYGWHHQVYDLWAQLFEDYQPAFFTGRESAAQKAESERRFKSGDTKLLIMSLRSGAGLDGLQYVGCSNVVFGELDWSPAVHEQAIGRVQRDGIDKPVTAWFLVSDEGSDPTMAEVLGIKRGQLEGLRDPSGSVVAGQTDPDAIKRLARAFLEQHGQTLANPVDTIAERVDLSLFDVGHSAVA
jgi:SNF2 family DNA or RNA helicase